MERISGGGGIYYSLELQGKGHVSLMRQKPKGGIVQCSGPVTYTPLDHLEEQLQTSEVGVFVVDGLKAFQLG